MQRQDIRGFRFGRLVVRELLGANKHKQSVWICDCDCGNTLNVITGHLNSGHTVSCGCSKIERFTKHGLAHHREYSLWNTMKNRCSNPNVAGYEYYGGRGISVCERWLNSFPNFIADMGPRPSPEHSIDRINNNGNYEPANCRWATAEEQVLNRRNNNLIEHNGITKPVTAWSKQLGIHVSTLRYRLFNLKWNSSRAFSEPLKRQVKASQPSPCPTSVLLGPPRQDRQQTES
jgi:hypothetical protein